MQLTPAELDSLIEAFRLLSLWRREQVARTPKDTVSNPKPLALKPAGQ